MKKEKMSFRCLSCYQNFETGNMTPKCPHCGENYRVREKPNSNPRFVLEKRMTKSKKRRQ